jgi:hypothetical protein
VGLTGVRSHDNIDKYTHIGNKEVYVDFFRRRNVSVDVVGGRWVRRPYQVREGWLAPVHGAIPEQYDLPQEHAGTEAGDGGRPLALHLADLPHLCSQQQIPTRALEEFTSRWGLLGLFQHQVEVIIIRSSAPEDVEPHGAGMSCVLTAEDLFLALADKGCVPDRRIGWSRVSFRPGFVRLSADTLPKLLRLYFRGLIDSHGRLAEIGAESDEELRLLSWDYLAESTAEFLHYATEFRTAFEDAVVEAGGSGDGSESARLERTFAENLGGVRPHPHPVRNQDDGGARRFTGWKSGWRYPSLLSAAYGQLLSALERGLRPGFCSNPTCGKAFLGKRSDQVYCSPRCLNTVKHRSLRQRKRDEAALG